MFNRIKNTLNDLRVSEIMLTFANEIRNGFVASILHSLH